MKFTFTSDDGPGLIRGHGPETVRTVTFNAAHLDNILEEFELFLKGCGFVFEGHLDFIEDEVSQCDGFSCETCKCKCKESEIDMDGRC